MRSNHSRTAFARGSFIVVLLALTVTAARTPAWAASLALQGYYADFVLTLSVPQHTLAAGSRFAVDAHVLARGPDTAAHPAITFRGDDDLTLVEDLACAALSGQTLRCILDELAPSAIADQRIWSNSDPDARGLRLISGFAGSELVPTPTNPGLEVDAVAVELRGEHTTAMQLLNERPQIAQDLRLTWTFLLYNLGPSSLLSGRVGLIAEPSSDLACRAFGSARCEGNNGAALYLPIDGYIEIDVSVPPITPPASATYVSLTLIREEGVDVGGQPDMVSAAFEFGIFTDSFGGEVPL